MDQLVLMFALLFATILAEPLARRIGVASAVLMTLFGCVLALIPAVPRIHIPPDLILPLVLPPLLYAAARRTSWHQFAYLTDAVTEFTDRDYRLVGDSFWEIIEMLLSGFAFGLIGLELGVVLEATGTGWPKLLGVASAVVAAVVLLRLVWLLVTWAAARPWLREHEADEPYTWRETIVTWWAGMRGVATVALALAIPLVTDTGADFPGRTEILFIAFVVVLFTLLLQGPTLPLVVRLTGVHADTAAERELERQLWDRVVRAQMSRLGEIAEADQLPDEVYERLRDQFRHRFARADPEAADEDARARFARDVKAARKLRVIRMEVMEAGLREAQAARREPGMPADVVDRVTRRLDLGPTK